MATEIPAVGSCGPTMSPAHGPMTHVELTWIEQQIEQWIRFGRVAQDRIVDRRRRVVSFRPSDIFALVRWASNAFGTIVSRIAIVRPVATGEAYSTLPAIDPGGELLLYIGGWPKVERVLRVIDAVETAGIDPCDVAPDHWRHVHNRLVSGMEPRGYSRDRHATWLDRREFGA